MKKARDENFKKLKAPYKAMMLIPVAGLIFSILPIKPILVGLTVSMGIDPNIPPLEQDGGLIYLVLIILAFGAIILAGAAAGFLLIVGLLKATEGLSVKLVFRAFAKGEYPSHWLKNDGA